MYPLDDTIVAVASPPGGAARGIVRVSGPEAYAAVGRCFQADGHADLAVVGRPTIIGGSLGLPGIISPLPCEVYLWPAGRSYTGGPMAEIHTLGSPPLLEAALHALCAAGARMAEPGEFTLRAFLAGRIDLTQAEAVLGVIDAADPGELDVALAQLAGGLAGPLHQLRDMLLELLAHLEAGFDFADEDLPFISSEELVRQLDEAGKVVAKIVRQMASRGEAAGAIRAVLVGRPNTGKSSLFNALARRTGALVSEHPGTTRDYLTAELDLDGLKCQLIDTAGAGDEPEGPVAVRDASHSVAVGDASRSVTATDASHSVEQAARAMSAEQHRRAHVQILCIDSTRLLEDWERAELARPAAGEQVVVLTKIDAPRQTDCTHHGLRTSSVTGQGIDALREELRRAVLAAGASGAGVVAGTAARCRESLRLAAASLKRARTIVPTGSGEELIAAEVRIALDELGRVVGAVYTDDVLDRIFSRFCIGK